eukprot:jgi/Mesen1/7207/ME000371S06290
MFQAGRQAVGQRPASQSASASVRQPVPQSGWLAGDESDAREVERGYRWRVGVMTEMPPIGYVGVSPKCLLGFNKNRGEEISLRLRTDDLRGFRKYQSVKATLLHELAHMVHDEHDNNFKELDSQLNREVLALDWTRSHADKLAGPKGAPPSDDDDDDDSGEESDENAPPEHFVGGEGLRVGGSAEKPGDARLAASAAALRRVGEARQQHAPASNAAAGSPSRAAAAEPSRGMPSGGPAAAAGADTDGGAHADAHEDAMNVDMPSKSAPQDEPGRSERGLGHLDSLVHGEDVHAWAANDTSGGITEHAGAPESGSGKGGAAAGATYGRAPEEGLIVESGESENSSDSAMMHAPAEDAGPVPAVSGASLELLPPSGADAGGPLKESRREDGGEAQDMPLDDAQEVGTGAAAGRAAATGAGEGLAGVHVEAGGRDSFAVEGDRPGHPGEHGGDNDEGCDSAGLVAMDVTIPSAAAAAGDESSPIGFAEEVPGSRAAEGSGGRLQLQPPQPPLPQSQLLQSHGRSSAAGEEEDPEVARILEAATSVSGRIQSAVERLKAHASREEAASALQTVTTVLRNAMGHPDDAKFRRVRKGNPTFYHRVGRYAAAMDILLAAGFEEQDTATNEGTLVLRRNDPGLLWLASSTVEACMG